MPIDFTTALANILLHGSWLFLARQRLHSRLLVLLERILGLSLVISKEPADLLVILRLIKKHLLQCDLFILILFLRFRAPRYLLRLLDLEQFIACLLIHLIR